MATIRLQQNKINPLVLPVIFAEKLGTFEQYQVPVALTILEKFQFNGANPFLTGEVTAVMGDLTFFFNYLEQGKRAIVTSDLTRTIQLVVKNELTDYRGLRIGVATKGLFPFFWQNELQELLPEPKIVWIDNTYERIKALRDGEIDGLVAIEPFIQQILQQQPTKVLWHSKDSEKNMVMWCFDRDFYQANPQLVQNFHRGIEETGQWFNQLSRDEKIRQMIELADYTPEAAQTLQDFHFEPQHNYSVRDFQLLQDFLVANGKLTNPINPATGIAKIF